MLGTPGRGRGVRRAGPPVRSRARGAEASSLDSVGGSVGAGVCGERGYLCGLVHAFWRVSRGIPLVGRPALRMPDQNPSFGLADLRDPIVGLSIASSFGLRSASQINTSRLGLRIGSLRVFELFGGRGPRRVVNRRNVSGGRLLHPHRGYEESRVLVGRPVRRVAGSEHHGDARARLRCRTRCADVFDPSIACRGSETTK